MPSITVFSATPAELKDALIETGLFAVGSTSGSRVAVKWNGSNEHEIGISFSEGELPKLVYDGVLYTQSGIITTLGNNATVNGSNDISFDYRVVKTGIIFSFRLANASTSFTSALVKAENNEFPIAIFGQQGGYVPLVFNGRKKGVISGGATNFFPNIETNGPHGPNDLQLLKPYFDTSFYDGFYYAAPSPDVPVGAVNKFNIGEKQYVIWNPAALNNTLTNQSPKIVFEDLIEN